MFLLHRFPREEVISWFRVSPLGGHELCSQAHGGKESREAKVCTDPQLKHRKPPLNPYSVNVTINPRLHTQPDYINSQILTMFCIVECIVEAFVHTVSQVPLRLSIIVTNEHCDGGRWNATLEKKCLIFPFVCF